MKLFGYDVSIRKAGVPVFETGDRGWYPVIREPFAGAWQRNNFSRVSNPLQNSTVYRCVSLISSDVAKMRLRLMAKGSGDVWQETSAPAFSPVMASPNRFQNRIQFFESWLISKLRTGNAYILKDRDNRNVVTAMYVLDPFRVKPMVAPDGSIFYQCGQDDLVGVPYEAEAVPANEIIHDRMNCLFHPLVGMSPLFSSAAPALHNLSIQEFSSAFFTNAARPSGVLSAPGQIPQTTADRLKAHWEENYKAGNSGRVAVLGDGLKFEAMQQNAVDSQLIEQLKHTDETICTAFGVPGFLVGVMPPPNYNNAELLQLQYYAQCLQRHIHDVELLLSDGLGLTGGNYRAEFDLHDLFRMDTQSQITSLSEAVRGGIIAANEARAQLGYVAKPGADSLMVQQQMVPLQVQSEITAPVSAAPKVPLPPPPKGIADPAFFAAIKRKVRIPHAA